MEFPNIHNATVLMALIHDIVFLPLLDSGITGISLHSTKKPQVLTQKSRTRVLSNPNTA